MLRIFLRILDWFKKKRKVLSVLFMLFFLPLKAQTVIPVKFESQADVKVYEEAFENQGDLNVFQVDSQNQSVNCSGLWFYTKFGNQAQWKIFFTNFENQADLKIFYVKFRNQAGWRNEEKKQQIYWPM